MGVRKQKAWASDTWVSDGWSAGPYIYTREAKIAQEQAEHIQLQPQTTLKTDATLGNIHIHFASAVEMHIVHRALGKGFWLSVWVPLSKI